MAESANKKTPVVLYRGKSENYNAETHKNGVYFATDVNEIYLSMDIKSIVNGEEKIETKTRTYGCKDTITGVTLNSTGDKLVISKQDGSDTEIEISEFRPGVSLKYISATDNAGNGKDYAELQLLAKDGTLLAGVDATPFIKDGFLSSVEVKSITEEGSSVAVDYLIFTWNSGLAVSTISIDTAV